MNLKRNLSILLGVAIVCVIWTGSFACINTYSGSSERKLDIKSDAESYIIRLMPHKDTAANWQKRADELARKVENGGDFRERSDYAAILLRLGETAKSIAIYEQIEKEHPGEYTIAANLGTAYELSGNNEKAREWISEGIKRNKNSHQGTEWIHVKILDAKIALAKDPDWLKTHSITGLNFGTAAAPEQPRQEAVDHTGAKKLMNETAHALYYQLHERMGFVSAPDPVVADLLVDLGNTAVFSQSLEHAAKVYELALTYKPWNEDLVRARMAHCLSVIDSRKAAQAAAVTQLSESGKRRMKVALSVISILLAGAVAVIVLKDRGRIAPRSRRPRTP